jgi:hypothetical protein
MKRYQIISWILAHRNPVKSQHEKLFKADTQILRFKNDDFIKGCPKFLPWLLTGGIGREDFSLAFDKC